MGPRYDADYDALQCVVRNGSVCANCSNRIDFKGRRGDKGAWNKPCKGAKRPDPNGHGRIRCTYGGRKVPQHDTYPVLDSIDTQGKDQLLCPALAATQAQGTPDVPAADVLPSSEPSGTCDIDWFSMAE